MNTGVNILNSRFDFDLVSGDLWHVQRARFAGGDLSAIRQADEEGRLPNDDFERKGTGDG
ncbi:MAG: hypothetical protein LBB84_04895 [Tannerellaceae bacterium]|jgi:hypothetical protein|nr:hypothetical protein [Tannerellaceae bacterium]